MLVNSSTPNPLYEYLDEIGLPWRLSRAELAEKYGSAPYVTYASDQIEIPTLQPLVSGLLWPLSTRVSPFLSPHMPATEFHGRSWFADDARENLRLTTDQLGLVFGKGKTTESSNSIGHRWTFGTASVELHVWPLDMRHLPTTNLSHEREPRLRTACLVDVITGFRPRLSAEDRTSLEGFTPIARILEQRAATLAACNRPAQDYELEFIRLEEEDIAHHHGLIGCSADKSALIAFGSELYIVPMADIVQFQVVRTLPAKGAGGSSLNVECRCHYRGPKTKSLTICSAHGPDDLNKRATAIARATGKPLELMPYCYDA